jgi:hypothetical protein
VGTPAPRDRRFSRRLSQRLVHRGSDHIGRAIRNRRRSPVSLDGGHGSWIRTGCRLATDTGKAAWALVVSSFYTDGARGMARRPRRDPLRMDDRRRMRGQLLGADDRVRCGEPQPSCHAVCNRSGSCRAPAIPAQPASVFWRNGGIRRIIRRGRGALISSENHSWWKLAPPPHYADKHSSHATAGLQGIYFSPINGQPIRVCTKWRKYS